MKRGKTNPLFSFIRGAMVPRRTEVSAHRRSRKASPRSIPGMGMPMTQAQRLKEEKLLREIAKLGRREKNVGKKKVKRKKKNSRRLRGFWAGGIHTSSPKRLKAAKKQAAKRRRRPAKRNPKKRRELQLNLKLNKKQKGTLARFLRRATGRRVKVV